MKYLILVEYEFKDGTKFFKEIREFDLFNNAYKAKQHLQENNYRGNKLHVVEIAQEKTT